MSLGLLSISAVSWLFAEPVVGFARPGKIKIFLTVL
jgi:hypothetical protein